MSAFEYAALNSAGRTKRGTIQGDSAKHARQQLRDQGLVPISVEAVEGREDTTRRPMSGKGISAAELAIVMRQLAIMVGSGLALEDALRTLARQTPKQRIKTLILGVHSRVLEGHSLAESLSRFPHAFPELYQATVAAGEQSGHLDRVLDGLADYTERRQQMRQKTTLALLYPAVLTGVAVIVVAGLLGYVVPQVVEVFDNVGQELPWLTRALIACSETVRNWGVLFLIGCGFGIAAMRYALRFERPRVSLHQALLALPLVSRWIRGLNTARFASTLGILVSSAVPMIRALHIASAVLVNLPMRRALESVARKVSEGSSLNGALEQSGFFSPLTVQLISSGEASGNLEAMLERAAQNQERETAVQLAIFFGLFEPLLILVMGAIVLVIVIAILMPIFELNQLLN